MPGCKFEDEATKKLPDLDFVFASTKSPRHWR